MSPNAPPRPLENKTLEERVVRQLKLLRDRGRGPANVPGAGEGVSPQGRAPRHVGHPPQAKSSSKNANASTRATPESARTWDAAPTSYLLGELLRRAGDADSAAAWFAAADRVIGKQLELVEAAEKAAPPVPVQPPLVGGQEPVLSPFERERERLLVLRFWNKEQIALIKNAKEPNAHGAGGHRAGLAGCGAG